jgi:hypothetical protein
MTTLKGNQVIDAMLDLIWPRFRPHWLSGFGGSEVGQHVFHQRCQNFAR